MLSVFRRYLRKFDLQYTRHCQLGAFKRVVDRRNTRANPPIDVDYESMRRFYTSKFNITFLLRPNTSVFVSKTVLVERKQAACSPLNALGGGPTESLCAPGDNQKSVVF